MFLRRLIVLAFLVLVTATCRSSQTIATKITIGVINSGDNANSLARYGELEDYLASTLGSLIEIEPAFNEVKALTQINRQQWDVIFAPPGLAALAIAQAEYTPIFPLEGGQNTRSVFVVLQQSELKALEQLRDKVVALGQPGSATSYYLPIYNLYGMALSEIRLATTPKQIMTLVAQEMVDAGAISYAEFIDYRSEFPHQEFRVLHSDDHEIPSGAVLLAPTLSENEQQRIRQVFANASSAIAASAGYVTNAQMFDYTPLINVVEKVTPLEDQLREQPAQLYLTTDLNPTETEPEVAPMPEVTPTN